MLVNIQGNIIDTTQIYRIGELEEKYEKGYWHYFIFNIYFLNQQQLGFALYLQYKDHTKIGQVSDTTINLPYEVGNDAPKKSIYKAKAFYTAIIEAWNKDKSTIPEIKI